MRLPTHNLQNWLLIASILLTITDPVLSAASPKPKKPKKLTLEEQQAINRSRPISFGIVLYPGWQPLDVFGPLDLFFNLSYFTNLTLSIIAHTTSSPITTRPPPHEMVPGEGPLDFSHVIAPEMWATHTFETAPKLDILLVPGGMGSMVLVERNDTSVEEFIESKYAELEYLLSVCTGSLHVARSGILKGKKATTNKLFWNWVVDVAENNTPGGKGKGVKWVPSARWVESGKIWTSSGVAAGLDMTFTFLKHFYGPEIVEPMINSIEYAPHTDKDWDPFAVVHNVPGAEIRDDMRDCAGPVGDSGSMRGQTRAQNGGFCAANLDVFGWGIAEVCVPRPKTKGKMKESGGSVAEFISRRAVGERVI